MFELSNQEKSSKWKIWAIVSIALFLCTLSFALLWYFLFYLSPPVEKNIVENVQAATIPVVAEVETMKLEEKKEIVYPSTSIMIVGDIMLDRDVFYRIKKNNNDFAFPFAKITDVLASVDFRVGNLEGPITNNRSIIKAGDAEDNGGNLRFTFSPNTTTSLANNFDLLSLANNHITNFGNDGVTQTKKYLGESGINYFGDFYNKEELSYIHTFANNVKNFCIISFQDNFCFGQGLNFFYCFSFFVGVCTNACVLAPKSFVFLRAKNYKNRLLFCFLYFSTNV